MVTPTGGALLLPPPLTNRLEQRNRTRRRDRMAAQGTDSDPSRGNPCMPLFARRGWEAHAIERRSGEIAVGKNRPELRRAESGARDDGRSGSYPRVGSVGTDWRV